MEFQQYENSNDDGYKFNEQSPQKRRNETSNQINSVENQPVVSKVKKLQLNEIGLLKKRRQAMESREERGGSNLDVKSHNQLPSNSDLDFDNQNNGSNGLDKSVGASVSHAVIDDSRKPGKNGFNTGASTPF